MRPFVIRVSLLVGLLASALIVAAQPIEKPKDKPKEKAAPVVKVPDDAIIAIFERLDDVYSKSPKHILMGPADYKALTDELERLKRLSARPGPRRPSSCSIKGKVEGNLVLFTAQFEFVTEKADEAVRLGCGLAQATGVSLDGRTPNLRRPVPEKGDGKDEPEGFVVGIDKPGDHILTLDLVMALSSKPSTQGIFLDLPRVAVTTIDLELPVGVRDVRVGGKLIADTLLTHSNRKLVGGIGPAEKLDLTWQPAQAGGIAAVRLADGVIVARLDGKELNTEAKLTLRVQSGQVKEWKLLVPPKAELKFTPEAQARIARVEESDQKQTSLRTIHLKELTIEPLGVLVVHSQPAPKPGTGKVAPLGPFVVLGAARHSGSLLVCNSVPGWHPEFTPHADLTRRSVTEEEQQREQSCVAAFRYGPGTPTSDKPGRVAVVSWLDVEVESVRGQIKTRSSHQLRLVGDASGGRWEFVTSLEITPRWADVDRLLVQLPVGSTFNEEGSFPLPTRVQSITVEPTTRVVTIRLARGSTGERSIAPIQVKIAGTFSEKVPLETAGKTSLGLPAPIDTVQREGSISVTAPVGVELLPPDEPSTWAGLEVVRQTAQEIALRYPRQVPALLPLSWQPHRPEVVVSSLADVTLTAGEVRVTQELRYTWPSGPVPRLELRMSGDIAATQKIIRGGGKLTRSEARPGTVLLLPDETKRQGQDLLVVFEYRYPIPASRSGTTTLPLIVPFGAKTGDARVRLWSDPGQLPGLTPGWIDQNIEVVPGQPRLPVLVMRSPQVDSPLRVTLGERQGLFALIDRGLVRVEVGANGTQTYRVSYRLTRLEGRSLDFELPAPAAMIQFQATFDEKRIDYGLPDDNADKTGRVIRLRLSPDLLRSRAKGNEGNATLLEISYRLGPDRMRGSAVTTPLIAPRLLGEAGRIPTRWSVVTPPSWVVLGPEAGPATPRSWARRGWLLAPRVDVTATELECWLLDAEPTASDPVAAPSLVLWHDGASAVQLTHLPQQVWLLICSLGLVLVGLLLARLVLDKEGGLSSLRIWFVVSGFAIGLVVAGLFVPNLVGQLAYGCQPGVLVLVVLATIQRLLHERYRRQIVFLPSFSRSSKNGSSLLRPEPRPLAQHGQPSTVDVPRQIGSSINRIS